jgi:hypothetical protein
MSENIEAGAVASVEAFPEPDEVRLVVEQTESNVKLSIRSTHLSGRLDLKPGDADKLATALIDASGEASE